MKKICAFAFIFASACILQCASMDQTLLSNESIRKPLPPLSIDASYDPYLMRIDLVRAHHSVTKTVTKTNAQGKQYTTTETSQEPNSYHSLVIDFGNGIIIDRNQNLCFDLVRLYNLSKANGFKISYESTGSWGYKMDCLKDDSIYKVECRSRLMSWNTEGIISPTEVTINNPGRWGSGAKIIIGPNNVKIEDKGFFGGSSSIEKTSATTISFPGFWKESVFTLNKNTVEMNGGSFKIVHGGNRINFIYSGFFGVKREYTMIQASNST